MSGPKTPRLDTRDAAAIVSELRGRMPGFAPGWRPSEVGPGAALLKIVGRDLQALLERLNDAPDKNKLAFLDMLGVSLLPAQAARAPIVFTPRPRLPDGRVPPGTRVAAAAVGGGDDIVFETEEPVALAAAGLAEVVTVLPGSDAYVDHSADAAAGRPFRLFEPPRPIPHEVYLAHETNLALSGEVTVELHVELANGAPAPLEHAWEYWDGALWRGFLDFAEADGIEGTSFDGTNGLTRSGVIRLAAACAEAKPTAVEGITSHWLRGRLVGSLAGGPGRAVPMIDRIRVRMSVSAGTVAVGTAFSDGITLDLTKTFLPLGNRPQPGSAFYLQADELLEKAGARAKIDLTTTTLKQFPNSGGTLLTPDVDWQTWSDGEWRSLVIEEETGNAGTFEGTGTLSFDVPAVTDRTKVNDTDGRWLRAVLTAEGYGATVPVKITETTTLQIVEVRPPAVASLALSYEYVSSLDVAEHCLTWNDFQWQDHTQDAAWHGSPFAPFQATADATPALYFGFDKPLPADQIGLYLDVVEVPGESAGPQLRWETWDGAGWVPLPVADDTRDLALPGMIRMLWPGQPAQPELQIVRWSGSKLVVADPRPLPRFAAGDLVHLSKGTASELRRVAGTTADELVLRVAPSIDFSGGTCTIAALPRFGTPRTWIRARLAVDGPPRHAEIRSVHPNAAWAAQVETAPMELVGSGTGQAGESLFVRRRPVLAGEVVEVRELDGPRAAVEVPLLLEELARQGIGSDAVTREADPRTGAVNAIWVRWRSQPNLVFSGPDDRHYVIERSRGRLTFGDGRRGRMLPAGRDNVRVRRYRTGGGTRGNVAAGAVTKLLSGVPAQDVFNPRPAEGGAEGQAGSDVLESAPLTIRARRQAISLADYEAMAREASPAVAVARALPGTDAGGRPRRGWVKLVIVPHSDEARPQPSFELRRIVRTFLAARCPATIADHVTVTGADYLPVGVAAAIAPRDSAASATVRTAALDALATFLHPLRGGPDGHGWPFGRDVYLSDLAVLLEGIDGVDHVDGLQLLLAGSPVGEVLAVPADRIVVAGTRRLTLTGRED
ncbi:MAG TPA: putative baseplate assembly protein [Candidatus Limnocylindrales bacterium]|nr:putative baseplate assembly protein [Candidatus Limnocylindrales bacterium]